MLIVLLPILAHAFDLTAGDVTQGRFRGDSTGQHADAITTGRLALHLGLKRTDWTLSLSPSVMQLDIGEPKSSLVLLSTASLFADLKLTQRTALTLGETATYGQENIQALSAARLAPVQDAGTTSSGSSGNTGPGAAPVGPAGGALAVVAPANTTIRFGYLATSLGITQTLDRNWSARAYGLYSVSRRFGSSNSVANDGVFPDSRTIAGTLALSYLLNARNTISLTSMTSDTETDPSTTALISTVALGWNYRFERATSMTINVGTSYTEYQRPNTPTQSNMFPYGLATLNRTTAFGGGRASLFASLGLYPTIDGFYGTVTESFTSSAGVSWQKRRWSAVGMGYGTSSLGDGGHLSLLASYGAAETVSYGLDRKHWRASVGSYQTWQRYAFTTQSAAFWGGVVSIAYTTGAIPL